MNRMKATIGNSRIGLWLAGMIVVLAMLSVARSALAEFTLPTEYTVYVSSPVSGTLHGTNYEDEDIVRYSAPSLQPVAMHFDGSAAGVPASADIDAYDYERGRYLVSYHYMSFDAPTQLPDIGRIDDSDVVVYTRTPVDGSWSMYFDGSEHGLTTSGEDVDALSLEPNGSLVISTTGNFTVPAQGGGKFTGADEDWIFWSADLNAFTYVNKGTAEGIPAANDLHNYAYADNGTAYSFYSLLRARGMSNIPAGANDVIAKTFVNGSPEYALFWDVSAIGFPKIDAFDIVLP